MIFFQSHLYEYNLIQEKFIRILARNTILAIGNVIAIASYYKGHLLKHKVNLNHCLHFQTQVLLPSTRHHDLTLDFCNSLVIISLLSLLPSRLPRSHSVPFVRQFLFHYCFTCSFQKKHFCFLYFCLFQWKRTHPPCNIVFLILFHLALPGPSALSSPSPFFLTWFHPL